MRVCIISFKECWVDERGRWCSDGGFPLQVSAVASLFEAATIVITRGPAQHGGQPLPPDAEIVAIRQPHGEDARRKLSVVSQLPYYAWMLGRHIARADAVHVPLPGDISLLGLVLALTMRKPVIARYGGSWRATALTTPMNRVTKWLMRRFAGGRNVMLVTGNGPRPPAPHMHWIFSTAVSRTELTRAAEVSRALSAPPHLAYVGRLSPEKGVHNLIEVVARLAESGFTPMPRVTLVGGGPQRAALEQLCLARGCARHLTFAGQVDRADLSRILAKADLCVQPSLTEGFSKAWMDAMAHGLPLVTSEVGAAREVVGEASERGWLVPPGDLDALERTLRHVLTDEVDWGPMRARCRAYVEGRTLEAWATEIGQRCAAQWQCAFDGGALARMEA
jgi:glycosyltransferase involved in cell wall biosynthesis